MKFQYITRTILLLIILSLVELTYSQEWPKIYGDNFHAYVKNVFEDYDRGYLIGGDVLANANTFRYAWIIKTDINGNELWNKKFGNGIDQNYLGSYAKTIDQGLIVCGFTTIEDPQFDPFFFKLSNCGEIEWCKILLSEDYNGVKDVITVEDGYIGLLQYYRSDSLYSRIGLVKLNLDGEPLWIQYLAQADTLISNEEGHALLLTSNSNYLISGRCFYPGLKPFWISTDTAGEQIWDLKWSNCIGTCFQTIEHHDGIFYSMGYSVPPGSNNIPTIYKFDASGNEISKMLLLGDTVFASGGRSILKINYTTLLTGVVWSDLGYPNEVAHSEVFMVDTTGNLINRRLLLYEDTAPSILNLTFDNKIIVAGQYVVGSYWDIYLWKMNTELEDDTLYTQPLTYDSLCPYEIQSDTVDLDCGVFVNIDELPTKEEYESTVKISPNPARDWIVLSLPDIKLSGNNEITIYNLFGQEVMKNKVVPQNKIISLNIASLPPGLYLVTCKDSKNKMLTGKFVVN
jgi:hypothetical protein